MHHITCSNKPGLNYGITHILGLPKQEQALCLACAGSGMYRQSSPALRIRRQNRHCGDSKSGLVVGPRSFPGNPYDGDILADQWGQAGILTGVALEWLLVNRGYRGRDVDGVRVPHRGKPKRLTSAERRWLRRRQAVEPIIGHLKAEHRMRRCHLKGQLGDATNAVLASAEHNLRWLMRWLLLFCAWITNVLPGTNPQHTTESEGRDACLRWPVAV